MSKTFFITHLISIILNYLYFFVKIFNFNIIDCITKISCNDGFWHYYSYCWLNFTFLFLFFFLFVLLKKQISLWALVVYIFYCLYFYEIYNNFVCLNKVLLFFNVLWSDTNVLLINNLNKYHPFLFYINLLIFYFIYSKNYSLKINYKFFYLNQKFFNLKRLVICNLFVNYVVLFLGSWWAFQEGTWGGWWNWDPSELFGFGFFVSYLLILHQNKYTFNILFYFLNISNYFNIMIIWHYFIQINFELTTHNFGLRFFYFFNNNFFYLELFFILVISFFKNNGFYVFFAQKFFLIYPMSFFFSIYNVLSRHVFALIIIFYVLYSHFSLLNYFLWKLFNFNFFLITVTFCFLNSFFFFFLFFCFFVWINFAVQNLFVFWMFVCNFQIYLVSYFNKKNNFFNAVHFLILNIIFVNLIYSNSSLLVSEFNNVFCNENNKVYYLTNTLDFAFIEVTGWTNVLACLLFSWKSLFISNFFSYFCSNSFFFTQLFINVQYSSQIFLFFEPYLCLIVSFFVVFFNQIVFYNFWIYKNVKLLTF